MRRLIAGGVALAGALLGACAHIGPPPGGPPRFTPPVLVSTFPDSVRVLPDFHGTADFQFDEVVSEGSVPNFGYGNGTLEMLVMLSPDTAVPSVTWHRSRLSVRPKHGWAPNTVYRVELLPGLSDLQARPNVTKKSSVITFATGGPPPTRYLEGRAIDWSGMRGSPDALIDAFHLPDSAGYRALSDSTGRFRLGPLPAGPYLVEAVIDQDRNHRRNGHEAWDTVRITATRDSVGEIWVFVRDTLPPHAQSFARQDSTSIAVTFSEPIDPYQTLPGDSIRLLLLPDSSSIGPTGARPKALDDSLARTLVRRTPKQDSIARRDSLTHDSLTRALAAHPRPAAARAAAPEHVEDLPHEKRRALGSVLVIRSTGNVLAGKRYYVEVHGVRTAGGVPGVVKGTLDVPKEAVVDTTARADSLKKSKSPADSTHPPKPDSTRADSTGTTRPPARTRADSTHTPLPPPGTGADSLPVRSDATRHTPP